MSLGQVAESGVELVGCRVSSRVSFVFSGVLNPGYIFVNIGVDADIPTHEVSDLDPLELVFADDSSDSHFLSEMVQREGQREREMVRFFPQRSPLVPNLGEPCLEVACWVMTRALNWKTGSSRDIYLALL